MKFERFVIAACGRSGTLYASELFTRMGLPCAHQKVFSKVEPKPEDAQWKNYIGASSAFVVPVLNKVERKILIIHQVRNPWRVAQSLVTANHLPGKGRDNLYGHYVRGWKHYDDLHKRAAFIWWQWNLMIERAALMRVNYLFHRVEDYDIGRLTHILNLLDREFTWQMQEVFKRVETNIGSVRPQGPAPSLQGMPHGFWGMVNRYGYEKPS